MVDACPKCSRWPPPAFKFYKAFCVSRPQRSVLEEKSVNFILFPSYCCGGLWQVIVIVEVYGEKPWFVSRTQWISREKKEFSF